MFHLKLRLLLTIAPPERTHSPKLSKKARPSRKDDGVGEFINIGKIMLKEMTLSIKIMTCHGDAQQILSHRGWATLKNKLNNHFCSNVVQKCLKHS